MQFKNLFLAASAATAVSALPAAAESQLKTFNLLAIHSGSGVQYAGFNAAKGSLFAGLPSQNATCTRPKEQTATFYIKDGELYLYDQDQSATPQQFYVDRSGMGQGNIGYMTGTASAPRNSELTGWAIDQNNHLQFAGSGLIACPNSIDGAWSIWASTGVANPAGNKVCTGIAARVEETTNPNSCKYTTQ